PSRRMSVRGLSRRPKPSASSTKTNWRDSSPKAIHCSKVTDCSPCVTVVARSQGAPFAKRIHTAPAEGRIQQIESTLKRSARDGRGRRPSTGASTTLDSAFSFVFRIMAGTSLGGLIAGVPVRRMNLLRGDARLESGPEFRFVKLLADEDQLAQPLLAGVPKPIGRGVEHHLDPLKHHPLGLALDLKDAFAAINVGPHRSNDFGKP